MSGTGILPRRGFFGLTVAILAVVAVFLGLGVPGGSKQASANQPNGALEFTLSVPGCSTFADYKGFCTVTQGSTFVASVSLDAIPGPYDALAVTIAYTGVGSKGNPDIVWPDCVLEASNFPVVNAGCAIGIAQPSSTFTGTVFTASFNCSADGTLSLTHGPADTLLIDAIGKTNTEVGPDQLNIDCAPPTPTFTPGPTATPTPAPVAGVGFDAARDDGALPGSAGGVVLVALAVIALGGATWGVIRRRAAR